MHLVRAWQTRLWLAALCLAAQPVAAITISIDYTYDLPPNGGSNFFDAGNPQGAAGGAQAKAALEAAANYYSTILTDTFDPITVPAPYHSTAAGSTGVVTWSWAASFNNPSNNAAPLVNLTNPAISSDQYRIFAGGRSLSGNLAGIGGPGGFTTASTSVTGTNSFTPGDLSTINSTTAALNQAITTRGEPSGFSRWGGAITFDNDGSTQWFLNHMGSPSGNLTDFYSVALHELGHALGFGVATQWTSLVENSKFVGVNAENQFNGNAIPVAAPPNNGHWDYGISSVVYGSATSQEALMDPDIQGGTRKKLTALDAGALQDIGWSLGPPPAPPAVNGDYNNNGVVDAGDYAVWRKRLNQNVTLPNDTTPGTVTAVDYTVWRSNFGKVASGSGSGASIAAGEVPEPASGVLAGVLTVLLYFNRRTLCR